MNKKAINTVFIVGIFAIVMAMFSGVSSASNFGQVCTGLSSGKIDVSGSYKTLTITAPEGKLISRYCVKAGSVNQDLGPEYVDVNPPSESVVISHSSGKDISHYSIEYVNTPTTTTSSTSSTTSSTTTSTTTSSTTTTTEPTTTTTEPITTTTEPTTTTSSTTSTSSTSSTTSTTQPVTTTSTSTSTSTTLPVTTTTVVPTTTTIPTTTINVTTTEPAPAIMYQTIDRLASTGSDVYILAGIGLLMISVGALALILDKKSNKVD